MPIAFPSPDIANIREPSDRSQLSLLRPGWCVLLVMLMVTFGAPPSVRAQPAPTPDPPSTEPVAAEAEKVSPGKDPSAPPVEPEASDPPKTDAPAKKTKAAGFSQPQVPAFRGGSLGMPTPAGVKVAQAMAVATLASEKVTNGSTVADFSFFAKVGGLNLYDKLFIDIVGESYDQEIPQVVVGMPGALPKMVLTTITSAGIRAKYQFEQHDFKIFTVDESTTSEGDKAQVNITARQLFEGTSGNALSFGFRLLHPSVPGADEGRITGMSSEFIFQRTSVKSPTTLDETNCEAESEAKANVAKTDATNALEEKVDAKKAVDKATATRVLVDLSMERDAPLNSLTTMLADPGIRHLLASEDLVELKKTVDKGDLAELKKTVDKAEESALLTLKEKTSTAAAAEVAADTAGQLGKVCSTGDRRSTFYVSLSAVYLNSQSLTTDDGMNLELPAFNEVRASVGLEFQAGKEVAGILLPRAGAYATLSRNAWTNDYRVDAAQDENVRAWQTEFAMYASGHFGGGFSGVLSFGVLLPYGHADEPQGFINIAPSIGTPLGGDS